MVCCCLIPHLELALHPALPGRPVVVATWEDGVLCASPEAEAEGVRAGLTFRQAQQLCPQAELIPPDAGSAERLRRRLSAALYDLSPVVEVTAGGRVLFDLAGVPLPAMALREARARLRGASGFDPRMGLAAGPFAARLAASRARPGRLLQVDVAGAFLAPLPISELDLDRDSLERLDLLGLRTLGDIARLGPRQLESQVGPAGRRAARLARGEEPDRIDAWQPPRFTSAERQFEPPVEDREALLFVARALCDELGAELGLRGAGAKQARIRLALEGATSEERHSLVRHPLSSGAELYGLAASWLRAWNPAAPVSALVIELPELEPAGRRQLRLWAGGDGSREEVQAALERLQERFGDQSATRAEAAIPTSGVPGQRFRFEPV